MVLVQYQIATSMSMIMHEDLECHILFAVLLPPPALGGRVSDISCVSELPAAEVGEELDRRRNNGISILTIRKKEVFADTAVIIFVYFCSGNVATVACFAMKMKESESDNIAHAGPKLCAAQNF